MVSPYLDIEEGKEVRFDVDDPARGHVRLLCTKEQMVQILLRAELPGATHMTAGLSEGGVIEFVGLEPGTYVLRIVSTEIRQETLRVEAGRTVERVVEEVPIRQP
jgi:hypothetical protein